MGKEMGKRMGKKMEKGKGSKGSKGSMEKSMEKEMGKGMEGRMEKEMEKWMEGMEGRMKKRVKRIGGILFAAVFATALLAGCQKQGGAESQAALAPSDKGTAKSEAIQSQGAKEPDKEGEKGQATTAKDEKELITLRFVSWQTNHDAGNKRVAEEYKKLHPNVTVRFDYVGDMNSKDYLTKTDIMLMGGEPIDILMTSSFADYTVRADSGSYLPLDAYFEQEGVKAEDAYNVLLPVNGGIYGIPGEMKYNMVLINKDMLAAAGLLVPSLDWTWDDYRDYARKLTSGSGSEKKYGSYFHSWGNVNLWGITSAKKGNGFFNDDHTLTFQNPEFSRFLKLRYDMENTDQCSTPLADVKSLNMNYRDQFFNGTIAMLPMGTFMLGDIGNEKYSPKFTTTFARQPLWEKGGKHFNVAAGTIFSVAKTSKHPKEAYDFLRFWTTKGVTIKGMFISNEKGSDKMDSVNQIINGFRDKVDVDALTAIMQDPKWEDSYEEFTPPYQSQIDGILTEETDKYLLGAQSLDDTVKRLMNRGNEIIGEN